MLINLHSHLEGRVRPSTAAELSRDAGLPQPPGGWERAIRLDGPADLTSYLTKVAATYPLFRAPDAIARIAREAVEDGAAAGLDYLELRFGPATHTTTERGLEEVIAAAIEGITAGTASTGMPAGLVVAALRHHAETNEAVARAAARWAGRGVVGFDLAGDELLYPGLSVHANAFAIARAAGLGITCHAAEAGPASAAREAVQLLGATRIGHGAHLVDDPDELRWAADAGVVVEICPTSNWYTGAIANVRDHPANTFRDAGVRLALGDDNPMQTGTGLARSGPSWSTSWAGAGPSWPCSTGTVSRSPSSTRRPGPSSAPSSGERTTRGRRPRSRQGMLRGATTEHQLHVVVTPGEPTRRLINSTFSTLDGVIKRTRCGPGRDHRPRFTS